MDSRDTTFEYSKGRVTIFWAHIFGGGRIFGLLTEHSALLSLQKQVYCQPRMHELHRGARGHAHAPPEKITENWTLGNDISCIPWIERN